jgi:putative membrane protein
MSSNRQNSPLIGSNFNAQSNHPLAHLNPHQSFANVSGGLITSDQTQQLDAVQTAATRLGKQSSASNRTAASVQSTGSSAKDTLLGKTTQSLTGYFPEDKTLSSHSQQVSLHAQATTTNKYTSSEENYLKQSAQGSVLELDTAELALQKTRNPQVQQYAQRLISDHAQYNIRLMRLGRRSSSELPVTLDQQSQSELSRLDRYSGSAFDRQFVQAEADANAQDVSDANQQLKTATTPSVRTFVSDFLPTQQQHLQIAESLGGRPSTS